MGVNIKMFTTQHFLVHTGSNTVKKVFRRKQFSFMYISILIIHVIILRKKSILLAHFTKNQNNLFYIFVHA